MPTQIKDKQTLLFIGDSITDCGRREAAYAPLGCGYARFVSDFLTLREPKKSITVINRGIGGNTVEDLRSRWHDDVFSFRPDWLSIKIGINDLNAHLCGNRPEWLHPAMFESIYREILTLTRHELPKCQILLISPFFLSYDTLEASYRCKVLKLIPQYIKAVEKMRDEFGTRYIPLQKLFAAKLKTQHPDVFAPEPVHPNQTGHLFIAEEVYAALS